MWVALCHHSGSDVTSSERPFLIIQSAIDMLLLLSLHPIIVFFKALSDILLFNFFAQCLSTSLSMRCMFREGSRDVTLFQYSI